MKANELEIILSEDWNLYLEYECVGLGVIIAPVLFHSWFVLLELADQPSASTQRG